MKKSISTGSGEKVRLEQWYIDEVRGLVSSARVNDLWHGLVSQPLGTGTQIEFRNCVSRQDSSNQAAADRLAELYDFYLEFIEANANSENRLK